jgi:hypothetical protein
MFTWMAIDRTNVSGVLTSTFLKDTHMTRDQANTGVSLLWFGIVLLEIPSNVSRTLFALRCLLVALNNQCPGGTAPHRGTLLDTCSSRRLGPDRGPTVLCQKFWRLVRRASIPGACGERVHTRWTLYAFAMVYPRRARQAHSDFLFWSLHLRVFRFANIRRSTAP